MDFEKKYRITQLPGETVKAMWTRGYREIEIYYRDQLILTHAGVQQLKQGVKYQTKELGQIELKLSVKPVTLDVIIDGYHCVNNVSHPAKQLKGASAFFWMIAVFGVLASLMDGINLSLEMTADSIITLINLSVVLVYVLAAVFTNQSKPWAFYMGFSMFCFWTLISLLTLLSGNFFLILAFGIRMAFLYFLIVNVKYAVGTSKHNKFYRPLVLGEDILDTRM